MNRLTTPLLLFMAYVGIYFQCAFNDLRSLAGVQISLLPILMTYAGLHLGLAALLLLSILGGLLHDALSANPLGLTVLPLFAAGMLIHQNRHILLKREAFAQALLGALATASVQLLSVLMLIAMGDEVLLGPGSLWIWIMTSLVGGALSPILFSLLELFEGQLNYPTQPETTFRKNRQIKRGRN